MIGETTLRYMILFVLAFCLVISDSYAQDDILIPGEVKTEKLETDNENILGARATGVIEAPIDTVWKVLNDFNKFKEFMPNMDESFLVDKAVIKEIKQKRQWDRGPFEKILKKYKLNHANSDTVCSYSVLDLPWPAKDRWYLIKNIVNNEKHTKHWSYVQGNMKVCEGSWELQHYGVDNSQTVVVYTTYSDAGGDIPKWIVELGYNVTLEDVIIELRKRVLR
ncbi:SRPBCC family protein [candidate division KSB1 bacterium]